MHSPGVWFSKGSGIHMNTGLSSGKEGRPRGLLSHVIVRDGRETPQTEGAGCLQAARRPCSEGLQVKPCLIFPAAKGFGGRTVCGTGYLSPPDTGRLSVHHTHSEYLRSPCSQYVEMRLHDFLHHRSPKCLYRTFVVSSTIPKGFRGTGRCMGDDCDAGGLTPSLRQGGLAQAQCTGSLRYFPL